MKQVVGGERVDLGAEDALPADAEASRVGRVGAVLIAVAVAVSPITGVIAAPGAVDVRLIDVVFLGLVAVAVALARRSPRAWYRVTATDVPGAVFLLVLCASAVWVAAFSTGATSSALASAARMVETAALLVITRAVVSRLRPSPRPLFVAIAVATIVPLAIAAVDLWLAGGLAERVRLNTTKAEVAPLAVAVLVIALALPRLTPARRLALAAIPLAVMLSIESMSGYAAMVLTLPVVAALLPVWRKRRARLVAGVATFVACVLVSLVGLRIARPEALSTEAFHRDEWTEKAAPAAEPAVVPDSPSDEDVGGATILHRVILAWQGFEVFLEQPLTGVGWTRSDDPDVVGAPGVVEPVKRRFPQGWPALFGDVNPSGPHDALLHVLAELGVIGAIPFALFLGAGLVVARRKLREGVGPDELALRVVASGILLSTVFALVTTGLFPGQPETVLLVVALGVVTAFNPGRSSTTTQ